MQRNSHYDLTEKHIIEDMEVFLELTYKIINAGWEETGWEVYQDELTDVNVKHRRDYTPGEIKVIEEYIEKNFILQ